MVRAEEREGSWRPDGWTISYNGRRYVMLEATENVVASDDISPPASTPAEAVMMEKEAKDADTHGEKTLDI
jgi:hypothetical protein